MNNSDWLERINKQISRVWIELEEIFGKYTEEIAFYLHTHSGPDICRESDSISVFLVAEFGDSKDACEMLSLDPKTIIIQRNKWITLHKGSLQVSEDLLDLYELQMQHTFDSSTPVRFNRPSNHEIVEHMSPRGEIG